MRRSVEERYDAIARSYQDVLTDPEFYAHITARFCAQVNGKILDAACGNGFVTSYLHRNNPDVIGVDISRGMIAEASKAQPHIDFRRMDLSSLEFDDASFGGVFCFQAFEHIQPHVQSEVLSEFSRVLKPGGLLMFNTNHRNYPRRFALAVFSKLRHPSARFGELERAGRTRSYRYLSTVPELRQKVKAAGFEIVDFEAPRFGKWIQIWARKGEGAEQLRKSF